MMKGQIVEWNDSRGYGFISSVGGELRVFFHISSVKNRGYRPKLQDNVSFNVIEDEKGRLNAENVIVQGTNGFPVTVLFSSSFLVAATASIIVFKGELLLIPLYLILSIFTYFMFAWDKQAAQNGSWRTQESTLHILSLLGGWPGALFAQFLLRHKSRKQPFKFILWVTILLNVGGFVWLFTESGRNLIQGLLRLFS
ncbi:CSD domain-containing protein [Vibrio crassostreae]|nr:CSD domain-containing protein [Vibrio crassostreae]CAK2338037.1 CSD domain-containing protein [Vibrio crassostreae]CAK2507476.1 CSD domain-containing protein [Vibrio crassostreae]CAK2898076.1 CSD domain-containing protein [Vibrio crassostreae]